jgi:hypothetical protein
MVGGRRPLSQTLGGSDQSAQRQHGAGRGHAPLRRLWGAVDEFLRRIVGCVVELPLQWDVREPDARHSLE